VKRASLKESHASTIDYVISATAGRMMGTFGGALEARQVDASDGKLITEVKGEVESEEGVLVIRRIHAATRLIASEDNREVVECTHGITRCVVRFTGPCTKAIDLTSSVELVSPNREVGLKP
jgi:hypothetical protein